MTDEEKASDIYDICLEKKSIYCNRKMGEETCSNCRTYKMYKLGLAEGRKEEYEMALSQIKRDREKVIEYNEELVKKNAELKAQNKIILEDNDTLNKWVDELKAQNGKMKCCGNCKKVRYKSPMIENDCTWCTKFNKWEKDE